MDKNMMRKILREHMAKKAKEVNDNGEEAQSAPVINADAARVDHHDPRTVYVVGRCNLTHTLFQKNPVYSLVPNIKDAEIVVFTGGEDINPAIYNQRAIPGTRYNLDRDAFELDCYHQTSKEQFKVGICRGGQLLCALNDEPLYQDCDNHAGHNHPASFETTDSVVHMKSLVSVHHQMMNADLSKWYKVKLLGRAYRSTYKADDRGVFYGAPVLDQEALYFGKTRSFCFQSHPEYDHTPTKEIFFRLLDDCIVHHAPKFEAPVTKEKAQ